MNFVLNNQSYLVINPVVFNRSRVKEQEAENNPVGNRAVVTPVVITRLLLKEIEIMKTSFRNQVRNVVALEQFIRKRLQKTGPGLYGAEPALIGINLGEELSFRLSGSGEAFDIFTATLQRKSYFLQYHSQTEPGTNILKVDLKVADLTTLEQELSIILENMKPLDYVFTVLQQQQKLNSTKQKLVG